MAVRFGFGPQRALLFVSTPEISIDRTRPNLIVYDLTDVPSGAPPTEATSATPGTLLSW